MHHCSQYSSSIIKTSKSLFVLPAFYFQSSDSIDADIPAAPSLLSPDPASHSQPLSPGSTAGNSALDELDLLGKTLMQQSLPPEGLQVKWYFTPICSSPYGWSLSSEVPAALCYSHVVKVDQCSRCWISQNALLSIPLRETPAVRFDPLLLPFVLASFLSVAGLAPNAPQKFLKTVEN